MRRISTTIIALVIFFCAAGCTSRSALDDRIVLNIAGPVAVEVESFNGDVKVLVDDRLDHATVRVKRVADYGWTREKTARKSLDEIDYSVELVSGPEGPVLRVKTWTSHPEPHYQRAHVTIRLPGVNRLQVTTNRGRVVAVDTRGETEITTVRGSIRFMTTRPITKAVTLHSARGDIDFRVRGESVGLITAESSDGDVDQHVRYGNVRVTEDLDRRKTIILNDGTNPIRLTTDEGNVRIAVVANPTDVGTFIRDP